MVLLTVDLAHWIAVAFRALRDLKPEQEIRIELDYPQVVENKAQIKFTSNNDPTGNPTNKNLTNISIRKTPGVIELRSDSAYH